MGGRIGIIAEGTTDYKFLPAILERIAKDRVGIEWPISSDDLDNSLRIRKTGFGGVVEKVTTLIEVLKKSPSDHSFYVVLLDRKTTTAMNKVKKSVSASDATFAIGIAIEEIEAWVLADRTPLIKWLGIAKKDMPSHYYWDSSYNPEGDRDPKKTLDELTNTSNMVDSRYGNGNTGLAAQYSALWKNCADINAIETSCPKGFKPFCRKVTNGFRKMNGENKRRTAKK